MLTKPVSLTYTQKVKTMNQYNDIKLLLEKNSLNLIEVNKEIEELDKTLANLTQSISEISTKIRKLEKNVDYLNKLLV